MTPNMFNRSRNLELRRQLAERFPQLAATTSVFARKRVSGPGTESFDLDDLLAGRLPKGVITELIEEKPSAGSALILATLIRRVCETEWLGLIDSTDSFDPTGFNNELLARLLWVRCRATEQALKAADLLLRDGNLRLVLLDLTLASPYSLRKIPSSTWHRFQRIIEHASAGLLVATPSHLVTCAQFRFSLQNPFTLDALQKPGTDLVKQLRIQFEQKQFRAASEDSDSGALVQFG